MQTVSQGIGKMTFLYNIFFLLGWVMVFPFLAIRALRLEHGHTTMLKRLCPYFRIPGFPRRPIWIHALSVGEVLSAVTLIKAIKACHCDRPIVCSVSTYGGHQIANRALAKEADFIFFFPYDFLWNIRHLVRRIDPLVLLLVEGDIWPNCLYEMARQGVPAILVNGRLSPRSYMNYKRISFFMRSVFSNISFICAQTELDAKRFVAIGAPKDKVEVTGNLKFDYKLTPLSEEEISALRMSMGIDPRVRVLLAGSTHEGEEKVLLNAFKVLKKSFSDLVLVVVPRDPARAHSIQQMFGRAGCSAFLKTELEKMDRPLAPDAIIVDTMGELRQLYAIADVVFVGKSLVNLGGQNPLEPAAFKKPILFGPYMFNFELVAETLIHHGAAVQVANEKELMEQVKSLLLDAERCDMMGMRAYEVLGMNRGAVDKTLQVVEGFL